MKMNKKMAALIAGLACVVLLLLLLLSMCSGEEAPAPTAPTESAPVAETTQQTEATTEQTEEATEATEETTEATEETTEPTEPSGNTRPGGTGGYNPGLDSGGNNDTNNPPADTTPAAGSEQSPYLELVSELPQDVQTVAVPGNGSIYQNIVGLTECVLTVEDADSYVVYGEKTFEPDDLGVVTVPVSAPETENTPVTFQIGNRYEQEKTVVLCFRAHLGTEGNPEPLPVHDGIFTVKAALEAGDEDGYFYGFTAEENSRLTLQVDQITENTACDIVVTVNETVTKLSDSEDGILSVEVKQMDTALIQVIAVPTEDGSYPATEVEISGTVESAPGSSANPIEISGEFPIVTDEIAPGASVFYSVYHANNKILTVESANACITIDGVTYAPVDGVISVPVQAEDPRTPVIIVVGNTGEEAESFTVDMISPLGSMENPEPMTEGLNTATIEEGDTDGYWYSWTAETDIKVTITMDSDSWMYQVAHISGDNISYGDTQWSDSDPVLQSYEVQMQAGDVLKLMVNTYDPENMFTNPAGEIDFFVSVVRQVNVTYQGATLTLEPDELVVCNAMIHADNINLKVVGEAEFIVTVDGREYYEEDGVVFLEGMKSSTFDPMQFVITNVHYEPGTYTISFENPVGSMENPAVITDMGEYTAQVDGAGQGYYYTWTAPSDGELTVQLLGDDWVYTVNNLTSYRYGENRISTNGDAASDTLTVSAGDEIQINLGTASREKKDVTFAVSFESTQPLDITYPGTTLELEPGETVSCYARVNADSINLKVTGSGDFAVNLGGMDYIAAEGVVTVESIQTTYYDPVLFTLSNTSDVAGTYVLTYENPVGSMENPAVITQMGEYTAEVSATGQGYYYTWTATADGELTVQVLGDEWSYTVHNLTAYIYGDNHVSSDETAPDSETISVSAGDEIQINLGTTASEKKSLTIAVSFVEGKQEMTEPSGEETDGDDVTGEVPENATQASIPEESTAESVPEEPADEVITPAADSAAETGRNDTEQDTSEQET